MKIRKTFKNLLFLYKIEMLLQMKQRHSIKSKISKIIFLKKRTKQLKMS